MSDKMQDSVATKGCGGTEMNVFQEIVEAVSRTTLHQRSDAKKFQRALENELRAKGWKVLREFCVKDRGDGVRGRIDLVVTNPTRLAIELDRVGVRKKSRFKLSQFDGLKFVILRQSGRVIECELRRKGNSGDNTKIRTGRS
jgi:hypothetical protein